jgi:hypothetical protein
MPQSRSKKSILQRILSPIENKGIVNVNEARLLEQQEAERLASSPPPTPTPTPRPKRKK